MSQQYLNILSNSIIIDKTGESLEYRHLIKCNNHIETWVRNFANKLGCLSQRVGNIVKVTNTCVSLVHETYQNTKEKTLSMDKLFSIKDPKRKNHIEHDWWKDVTSSVFLVIKALELQTSSQQHYNSTIPTKGT